MLPNRMVLNRQTEEQLKRLKGYTGITPNVAARLAFFRSVESEFRYSSERDNRKLDGKSLVGLFSLDISRPIQLTVNGGESEIEDALSAVSSEGYG